jgi:hypothetical protein
MSCFNGILGYRLPAPETARQWLDRFHDEALMAGQPLQGSFIPAESRRLAGLREINRRTIWGYVEAIHPGWEVTLDNRRAVDRDEQGGGQVLL